MVEPHNSKQMFVDKKYKRPFMYKFPSHFW